jgi:hypothetical protein
VQRHTVTENQKDGYPDNEDQHKPERAGNDLPGKPDGNEH